MSHTSKSRPQSLAPESNPLLIQSYFDGELGGDELEALSLEAITSHPVLEALKELRDIVRYDSQQALEDIDDTALLNAIHRQIASEKQLIHVPKAQASPSSLSSRARLTKGRHWAPVFIGIALLLLSIPGLVMLFVHPEMNKSDKNHDIVCVDGDAQTKQHASISDSPKKHNEPRLRHDEKNDTHDAPAALQVPAPRLQMQNQEDQQLTVEEMGFAIRHLIGRIENLENVNRNSYDHGDQGLARPAFETQNSGQQL